MCQYKDKCPSCSGWCESKEWDYSRCIPFLITAYENAKQLDETLHNALNAVALMDSATGVPQSTYVVEECAELIKELMKKQRRFENDKGIISEACDVLTTIYILFIQLGVSDKHVKEQIIYKCNRALARYNKNGEV